MICLLNFRHLGHRCRDQACRSCLRLNSETMLQQNDLNEVPLLICGLPKAAAAASVKLVDDEERLEAPILRKGRSLKLN